jgi:RHS repeat-associated protein
MIAEFTFTPAAGALGCTAGAAPVSVGEMRLRRSYAWGYDVSGTLTGAGGVGGLLLLRDYGSAGNQTLTLAPLYDWNGNVMGYADVESWQVRHRFEYDAFGQELSVDSFVSVGAGGGTSTHSSPPPVRFSSKYTDAETGLVYYGYRSYSPQLGRWISRDPIEERGGTNLYGMVGNDAVNRTDYLGLADPARAPRNSQCCTQAERDKGEAQLKEIYSKIKAEADKNNVPTNGTGKGNCSCYNLNSPTFGDLTRDTPKCWTCVLEHRQRTVAVLWTADHWAVVCQSYKEDGSIDKKVTFDLWNDANSNKPPEDGFYKRYPDRIDGSQPGPPCDCNRKPPNYPPGTAPSAPGAWIPDLPNLE